MSVASLPNLIGERYRPIRLLGRGGGGAVYEAEHLHTGARVALKVLAGLEGASPEAVARFRREARLAAAIDSEHVVRITDAGTADELGGTPFLVMELIHGHTLEHEAREPLEPARVVELLSQVARALERAHAVGIIHRDLKPENMFLTRREDGRPWVKVLDFGIAKRTGSETHHGGTEQGTVLGTPMYMSPEQAQGQGALIDARTDTWALGMIAFRLLFGLPYFAPENTLRLLHRVVFEPIASPAVLGFIANAEFDAWFLRSCSHDRSERFVSPVEQVQKLGEALAGLSRVEIRRHILEARVLKHSASTVQQLPSELHESAARPLSGAPLVPWSDGPLQQARGSDSGRGAHVALAEGTPANLPSVTPAARAWSARTSLGFVLIVLVAAGLWLWRTSRTQPLANETAPERAVLEPASSTPRAPAPPRTGALAQPTPASALPTAQDTSGLATGAPDAALPLPKPSPRPERAAPARRGAADKGTHYDPLGDRH